MSRRKKTITLDTWRMPDALWEQVRPLLPPGKPHPLGCHNPAKSDREIMDVILLVLRSGIGWNALNATPYGKSTTVYRRFREWQKAGVFKQLRLLDLDAHAPLRQVVWDRTESQSCH